MFDISEKECKTNSQRSAPYSTGKICHNNVFILQYVHLNILGFNDRVTLNPSIFKCSYCNMYILKY